MTTSTKPSSNDLSLTERSVKSIKEMLFHLPLTDETKIQFIKEELSAGRYQIESQSLAEKLIEYVLPTKEVILEEIF